MAKRSASRKANGMNKKSIIGNRSIPHKKPIWEVFKEILKETPETALDKLPKDAAARHDKYLYGAGRKAT